MLILFKTFLDLTCHLEDTEISSEESAPQSVGMNTGVVLVPYHARRSAPTVPSGSMNIPKIPECHFYNR